MAASSALTSFSSPSSFSSSPRAPKHSLVGSTHLRSMRLYSNWSLKRLGGNVSAAASSSDETDVEKLSSVAANSTSTTTTTAAPSPPSVPQDTIPDMPATAKEWELDFGSRPVLDERGKKWWELLIVAKKSNSGDDEAPWVYSRWLPNTKINSAQVRNRCLIARFKRSAAATEAKRK